MIDTCEVSFLGPVLGGSEVREFCRQVPGVTVSGGVELQSDSLGFVGYNYSGYLRGLGTVRADLDGIFRMGRSLIKTRQELLEGVATDKLTNHRLMTADQVNETFYCWTEAAREYFPWLKDAEVRVTRADVVYDRRVFDSIGVIGALRGGVKPTRGGCAWFDNSKGQATGLILRGKKVLHRVYDKGLESGQASARDILRSEEQLRRGSVGLSRILGESGFLREECVNVLNDRYLDVGYAEDVDRRSLLESTADARLVLFVLHPELLDVYRHTVSRSTYQRVARQVREVRASGVPVDLRVPSDAWLHLIADEELPLVSNVA